MYLFYVMDVRHSLYELPVAPATSYKRVQRETLQSSTSISPPQNSPHRLCRVPGNFQNEYNCDHCIATVNPMAKLIYKSTSTSTLPKAIAFDLDETIGSFSDLHSIWSRLESDMRKQDVFNKIMRLYPEFLRVGIISILSYIRRKQEKGDCLPIYIYTNNQCEDVRWITNLIIYLESIVEPVRVNSKLFADPICAFKIAGRRVEPNRTTHSKTYDDFVRCSMLKSNDLCFIDDSYHEKMKHRKVYYIQPPPYVHRLPYSKVIDRFITSNVYKELYPDRSEFIANFRMSLIKSNDEDPLSNAIVREEQNITNKIMYFIREFFCMTHKKRSTVRKFSKIGKFSRKNRKSFTI